MTSRFRLASAIAVAALAAVSAHAAKPLAQQHNPYLAQSYNNQTHWDDAASDSTDIAVPRGFFEVTPESVQLIPNESVGLPSMTDTVAGQELQFWWSGFGLRKMKTENGKLVEIARSDIPMKLPNYAPVSAEERRAQAAAVQKFIEAKDEKGLLDYMKAQPNRMASASTDQVANGAVYAVLTRDDAFIGCNGRQVFRIEQEDPKNPASGMKPARAITLPASLFDNARAKAKSRIPVDMSFGLGMSFNGFVVINTLGGKVVTLNRETLEIIDIYTTAGADEQFMNSFATGPEANGGAVYVASNTTMYRLVVDANGKIHDDEASGAWAAHYDRGVQMPAPKIGDGTGSTPTLMGFGKDDDKLVVITDGAKKMRLVSFWRDGIPAGWKQKPGTLSPRIADQIEVDMGPGQDVVQSEQSVGVYGDQAFVVNNIVTREDQPLLSQDSYYVNLVNGATRPAAVGAAGFKWDNRKHAWSQQWKRDDVSSVSVVPMISGGSHMAIIDGYFAGRWGDRHHIGMDLDTGKTVMSIRTGSNPMFNGMYAPVKVDSQGNLLYGMAFGVVRMDTSKMKRIEP
ncbi:MULTISPECIES: hypothetical protein [unclassified Variovorax]|uniref:hypothetical protein n=1 Tax=unclassified Variovorax TaxID=663243 RepID=UPI00210A0392|nr:MULTISPECIES: hypothetical protein [unclassified Variovorax]